MPRSDGSSAKTTRGSRSLAVAAAGSLLLSTLVAVTAVGNDSPIGAPLYWPWLLTGLQVLALWVAGRRGSPGWLLGAAVQPPWIAYALFSGQIGFIPGCAISAVVQAYSFLRAGAVPRAARGTARIAAAFAGRERWGALSPDGAGAAR